MGDSENNNQPTTTRQAKLPPKESPSAFRNRAGWRPTFRLREAMLLLTAFALSLGWFAETARRERKAEAVIALLDGSASYKALPGNDVPWLRRMLGRAYFRRMRAVTLPHACGDQDLQSVVRTRGLQQLESLVLMGEGFSDDALVHVAELDALRRVELWGSQVTDAGLLRLHAQRPNLSIAGPSQFDALLTTETSLATKLDLSGPYLTDAGTPCLRFFPKLQELNLSGTKITNDGLDELGRLSSLRSLELSNTRVTAEGLAQLSRCSALVELDISGVSANIEGANALASLPKLEQLHWNSSGLTDAVLAQLAALPNLTVLGLRNTEITPTGLQLLRRLPMLQAVYLGGNPRLSQEARRRLSDALPELRVYY